MMGFTHNNRSYNIKGVKVGLGVRLNCSLSVMFVFFVRKKSPCHPVWGARGFQATMAFFHSIFSERESFAMINRDEDDEERDRLQRHLRGVDDVRDVLPSLRASPPIRGVRVGTYPSSHQSRGASLEWYRLP